MQVNIFHGWANTSQTHWFPWIKQKLEARGQQVWAPDLPNTAWPELAVWLPYALENGTYDEQTILIGHSAGCPLILALLEQLKQPVKQTVLVAAFYESFSPKDPPMTKDTYDWDKIRANCGELIIINSDDDPFACIDALGRQLLEQIGRGTLIIPKGQGHFGSNEPKREYPTFPLLLRQLDLDTQ